MGVIEEFAETRAHGLPLESVRDMYRGKALPTGGVSLPDRVQFALGAQFVEVRVHALTHEIRVSRAVGAFAAGRIINPRTAHGQLIGGMIWGSVPLFTSTPKSMAGMQATSTRTLPTTCCR